MPSWNIHTAHVEKLLASESLEVLGLQGANLFLFGNFVPDIYVGHMVQPITRKLEYRDTHLTDPSFIPFPDAGLFYRRYLLEQDSNDLLLGAWTHLLCDHYYNLRAAEYIVSINEKPCDRNRIRKQTDFNLFGKTLNITSTLQITNELLELCAAFPQYSIKEQDVINSVSVQREIVRKNAEEHLSGEPQYSLLTPDFFQRTFCEVDGLLREALHLHASGGDPSEIGRSQL